MPDPDPPSDTRVLRGPRSVSRVGLFALLCLALAELAFGRTDWALRLVPQAEASLLVTLHEELVEPNPDPALVVFGTSRARGAFLPTLLERELGLERGRVLNLAVGGKDVLDALVLYREGRDHLSRARDVVLQLDGFQMSAATPPTDRYGLYASARDRAAYSGLERLELLRDVVFRLEKMRPSLGFYVTSWLQEGHAPGPVPIDRYGRLALVTIADDHDPKYFTPEDFDYWLGRFWGGFRWSDVFARQLLDLRRLVHEDGGRFWIVELPMVDGFYQRLRQRKGDPYAEYHRRLSALLGEGARLQFWAHPAEVGLVERNFRDWGHLNTPGAERFSRFFARWLAAETSSEGS